MSDEKTEKINNFDFTSIYPDCRNDFNNYNRSSLHASLYSGYSAVCNNFRLNIGVHGYGQVFQENFCLPLCYYLNYIKESNSKSDFNVDASCKYFYYKLKDLVKKYRGTCDERGNCYVILRLPRKNATLINVPDICMKVVEDISIIEENLYNVFYHLDGLYTAIHRCNKNPRLCKWDGKTCKNAIENLKTCEFKNNRSFNELITKFENQYNSLCSEPEHKSVKEKRTPQEISIIEKNSEASENARTQAIKDKYTSAMIGTFTDTGTGMVVLPFIIFIIVFVLFKYTSYGSYIQLGVKNLRSALKKKNKNHSDLIDSFEKTYKNSVDKKYKVAYASQYY
ncbi:variable surface protein [Plasmodium gonderi]|uniref:Variable surface protein n=1 Tax=Plasmodium gonderi TaxID=77519 RepID=A0A1Y1JNR0_PLAGO|nr:variable surface protein [Plasmodium gonderi]GAW84099.1 variable surface protein [Plasmodium gonderi]